MILSLLAGSFPSTGWAQSLLEKSVGLEARDEPLGQLLEEIGRQGGFYFSYHSKVVPDDSLVTITIPNAPVGEVLNRLLPASLEFLEAGSHVIIRSRRQVLEFILEDISERGNAFIVSGKVLDPRTGQALPNASVYERQLLLATLTDKRGQFRLRVRDRYHTVALTASKALYEDATVFVQLRGVVVLPRPEQAGDQDSWFNGEEQQGEVERTALGRFLVSSGQRIQSLNLREFFTENPVQASLTPGLSSQGRLSGQLVNKVSINLLGGYTAGVDGVEIAGVFNINRKSVRHVQAAGAFNIVGGSAHGVQIAGLHNLVLGAVRGLQAAGGFNVVKGDVDGVQVAGWVNFANHLRGVQVGVVNIADSSSGYSIGLVNIIRNNGYLQVHAFANESFPMNLAFKSGTSRLYAILLGGAHPGPKKLYGYGAGFGTRIKLYPKTGKTGNAVFFQPEAVFQEVFQGNKAFNNHLYRLNLGIHYPLADGLNLFAGPSLNVWNSKQTTPVAGYGFIPSARKGRFDLPGDRLTGWIGWTVGLGIF